MSFNDILMKYRKNNEWESLFPITKAHNVKTEDNDNLENKINIISNELKSIKTRPIIYGFIINENDSNPNTRVIYTDDCIGFSPIKLTNNVIDYGNWLNTFILNGNRRVNINGNIMSEFQQTWYKWEKKGSSIIFKISDQRIDDSYISYAFISEKTKQLTDKMYIGCFEGFYDGAKLRSIPRKTPTTELTIDQFRTYAKANGEGYTIDTFSKYEYINALLILVTKSTDLQSAIGFGNVDNTKPLDTAESINKVERFYGFNDSEKKGCIVFYIENWWGNLFKFIDGLFVSDSYIFTKSVGEYEKLSDYEILYDNFITKDGFVSTMDCCKNGNGLFPILTTASETTHYCDMINLLLSSDEHGNFIYGGDFSFHGSAGPFCLFLTENQTHNNSTSARLCYS